MQRPLPLVLPVLGDRYRLAGGEDSDPAATTPAAVVSGVPAPARAPNDRGGAPHPASERSTDGDSVPASATEVEAAPTVCGPADRTVLDGHLERRLAR